MEARKIIGYKLIETYPFMNLMYELGCIIYVKDHNATAISQFSNFPKNWQPVYEQAPVTNEDINEILKDIEQYADDNNASVNKSYIALGINKNQLLNKIGLILTKKLIPILFFFISIAGFSQKNLRNDFTLEADSGFSQYNHGENISLRDQFYARQSKILAISAGYHQYENRKDNCTLYGIVSLMMAPTIAGFFICKNNSDKLGMTFYGSYAIIDIGAVVMFIHSELKASKIKRHYLKLENQ